MIITDHNQERGACFFCRLPIEGTFIRWIGRVTIDLHPTCAKRLGTRLRESVYKLVSEQGNTQHPI